MTTSALLRGRVRLIDRITSTVPGPSVLPVANCSGLAEGVGQEPLVTTRAQAVFEVPVDTVLQIVGSHAGRFINDLG